MAAVVTVGLRVGDLGAVGGFVPEHVGLVALQHKRVDVGVTRGVRDVDGGLGDLEGVGVGGGPVEKTEGRGSGFCACCGRRGRVRHGGGGGRVVGTAVVANCG